MHFGTIVTRRGNAGKTTAGLLACTSRIWRRVLLIQQRPDHDLIKQAALNVYIAFKLSFIITPVNKALSA